MGKITNHIKKTKNYKEKMLQISFKKSLLQMTECTLAADFVLNNANAKDLHARIKSCLG